MELCLNILWFVVAAAAFACFRPHVHSARSDHQRAPVRILALTIALVVIFPSVSAADDLHGKRSAIEDTCSKLKKLVFSPTMGSYGPHHAVTRTDYPCLGCPEQHGITLVLPDEHTPVRLLTLHQPIQRPPPILSG